MANIESELDLPARLPGRPVYEAAYYGASHLIAQQAGVPHRRSATPWFHGVHNTLPPRVDLHVRSLLPGMGSRILTHREDQAAQLREAGYPALAVGSPMVYLDEPQRERREGWVLFVPRHSVAHHQCKETLEIMENIRSLKKRFERVAVSVYGDCLEHEEFMDLLEEEDVDWVSGAAIGDFNSLARMKALFESFEYIATDSYGSHLAYAAYFGAKVISVSPWKPLDSATALAAVPKIRAEAPELVDWFVDMHELDTVRVAIPHFGEGDISDAEQSEQRAWAARVLGEESRRDPKELCREFGWNWSGFIRELICIRIPGKLRQLGILRKKS